MKKDLTLCTVSYTHKELLNLNWDFTKKLNPSQSYTWIVVENTPKNFPSRFESGDPNFLILPGTEKGNHVFAACYHAASGFTLALKEVKTRFFLAIDPDLFVVRSNWMDHLMSYMIEKKLGFFGAPIYPTLYHKYRYFPCTQFMMIDLERIDGATLDFTPRYNLKYDVTKPNINRQGVKAEKSASARFKDNLRIMLKRGSIIDSSYDTAWQIYQMYKNQKFLYECTRPVLRLGQKPFRPRWLNSGWNRLLERVLPDGWRYISKRKDYLTEIGFKERGAFDAMEAGWDETMFQDQPFSFHMRGALGNSTIKNHADEIPELKWALASFIP